MVPPDGISPTSVLALQAATDGITSSTRDTMRMCFRNVEVWGLPSCSICRACVEQGADLANPSRESHICLPACAEVILPPSLRAELVSELLGLSAWIPSRERSGRVQSPPLLFSCYFSLSFGMCCQQWGKGQRWNVWGLSVLPWALKEKVNSYWSSDLWLWLVTNFTLAKIILWWSELTREHSHVAQL